jgi:Cu(I)/Ag(I) efflux system membrane fusion protein
MPEKDRSQSKDRSGLAQDAAHSSGRSRRPQTERSRDHRSGKRFRRWQKVVLTIVVGAIGVLLTSGIAYVIGYQHGGRESARHVAVDSADDTTTWTCSMHPQIKLPKPGKCPICFMDLILLENDSNGEVHPRRLRISPSAAALAEIQTTPVRRQYATNVLRFQGKVELDETRVANITAWVAGRLDRLYVDFTGTTVRQGDHMVEMYSPQLIVAQQELIQIWQSRQRYTDRNGDLTGTALKTVEDKLRLLGMQPEQIEQIKLRGKPSDLITIYAPIGGVVLEKHVTEGTYVETGTQIYTIADLSRVWVFLDAYESDLPWLRYGQRVEFTSTSFPGEIFEGKIAFIDPILNEQTRTVKVRVNVDNLDLRLKPGMFIRAEVRSRLSAGGRVFEPTLIGKWILPMHPEVVKGGPGKCDVCGMDLVPAEELGYVVPDEAPQVPLIIPATAPLITGKRAVVYVSLPDRAQPTFEGREVLLGERAGDTYIVRHGLEEGERVVTHGNFKIDSALQIKAEPSMMNPEGDTAADMHEVDTGGGKRGTLTHKDIIVTASFRVDLNPMYSAYLETAASLAKNDWDVARTQLGKLVTAAKSVDAQVLDEETRRSWGDDLDRLVFPALEARDAVNRDDVRRHFGRLSRAMTHVIATYGHALDQRVLRFHCPMALDARGADWLQLGTEVENPYYGPAMLRCGDRVATYESQTPLEVPQEFRTQLNDLYRSYLQVQTALSDDRLPDAKEAWQTLRRALAEPQAELLQARALHAWQAAQAELLDSTDIDPDRAELDEIRTNFHDVSGTILAMVDAFGHSLSDVLHKAYCPMAFDDQGAAWLQSGEKIANPYFGHQMLRCGEIQREFPPAK